MLISKADPMRILKRNWYPSSNFMVTHWERHRRVSRNTHETVIPRLDRGVTAPWYLEKIQKLAPIVTELE